MEKKIVDRIIEILGEEGGREKIKRASEDPRPTTMADLYGLNWVKTDKEMSWWGNKERERIKRGRYNTNLMMFEYKIDKIRKKEKNDFDWKEYWLRTENYFGRLRQLRLLEESKGRRRRCYSEGDQKIDEHPFFVENLKGEKPPFRMPDLPKLGRKYIPKMDKKNRK